MTLNTDNVKHERKKLRRMVNKEKKGEIKKEKVNECYKSWKDNAKKGNSYKLIKRTDNYLRNLRKEAENGN